MGWHLILRAVNLEVARAGQTWESALFSGDWIWVMWKPSG